MLMGGRKETSKASRVSFSLMVLMELPFASLHVAAAQALVMVKELEDVEVTEPEPATFQCEVSMAISKPPVWTLNGEALHSGPAVRLENHGTVHKLTLRSTSADMSGTVKFTTGKAKSSATLRVVEE